MSSIHSAIARARATREAVLAGVQLGPDDAEAIEHTKAPLAVTPPAQKGDDTSPRPADTDSPSVEAAWDRLPMFEVDPAHLAAQRIVTRESSASSAPFDVLRTRVQQQMAAQDWTRLAITSPGPSCGKSTVTMNLAFALARQPDLRTMVVDLDLRRPMLANLLGLKNRNEVSALIRGRSTPEAEIVRVSDTLAFATAQTPVRDPASLLQGRRIGAFANRLRVDFAPDIIIFDLPPIMVSDDAIAFLPHADCALMVAAAEQTSIGQVDACEREVAGQTNMLGVILNKCAHPGEGQRYGEGYAYGPAD